MPSYRFLLDGVETEVEADPKASVLDVLREQLGVYVVKAGCAPRGLCGCCTVLVDGKARLTCTLPVKSIAEKSITTLAGVPEADRLVVAEAFAACDAAPCGYCTPGIALSTVSLLQANTSPSEDELHRALAPHTCRCTGYAAILEGMRQAAAVKRGEAGRPVVDIQAVERVTGETPFVDDLVRPGMLHAVPVFAPVARGTVTTLSLPTGGHALVLRGEGSIVNHAGEAVALLAAPTMAEARALAQAVTLELAPIPAEPPAPVARARRRDGDVDAALAACRHRAEIEIHLAPTDAVPLEPEAALAVPTLDGLVLYTACRDIQAVAAACPTVTRIEPMAAGGDAGAKDRPQVEPWAVALAEATGKPVRLSLDHAEGTRIRPRRPGARVRGSAGCD
ncbi:MAG: molybdopterin-dependent oxidoreductase, partial [Deltaproteobacteria bacterium]|nr:molybdopterin-dependent oxidoreductase [Deltaproteobacteria bacterium]